MMKKKKEERSDAAEPREQPDIAGLIIRMQQQLSSMERKIDALAVRPPARPFDEKREQKPFQRFDQQNRRPEFRQNNNYAQRSMFKAVCADCKKECEVPFKPSGERPVYCKECFSKRKAPVAHFRENRPVSAGQAKPAHTDGGSQSKKGAMRKFGERKIKFLKRHKKLKKRR